MVFFLSLSRVGVLLEEMDESALRRRGSFRNGTISERYPGAGALGTLMDEPGC